VAVPKGSIAPKVEAVLKHLEHGGTRALLARLDEALPRNCLESSREA
jgi:carbamate kinase